MVFVAQSQYAVPLKEVDQRREEHLEWVGEQFARGAFIVSGRQDPPVGGVIVGTATTREAFELLLATDPFVAAGFLGYEVTAFSATPVALGSPAMQAFVRATTDRNAR